jgi:mono/diheme cytochrome c family protein
MSATRSLLVLVLASATAALGSCAQERHPGSFAVRDAAPDPASTSVDGVPDGPCRQARATAYPARLVTMGDAGAHADDVVFVGELVQQFQSACGACHGPTVAPQGGFQIATKGDFLSNFTAEVLAHVTSNGDPSEPAPMPPLGSPTGKPFRDRAANGDPIRDFAALVQDWLDAGRPSSFTRPGTSSGGAAASFTLGAASGDAMTTIGNCVPAASSFGTEVTRSASLDAMFGAASRRAAGADVGIAEQLGLPLHLGDTDLFTLESRTLMRYGVVAYAPAYPLWSDGAGKLRHVRVPRGTSIHFDEASQRFQIPANTRFYKTFMKPIVELDGSIRWKKIETRLIVARPNPANDDDTPAPPALFGTYRWNDAETDAILVQTLLRNGQPFGDTVLQYVSDEPLAAALLRGQPTDPDETLLEGHAARHYAIPSSERCVECHRGSPSRDFVLGFNPLQIRRRPQGEGGVIEPTSEDELTQLQRFIDYGLVTGLDAIGDVLPLERSEGDRPPRNDNELVAQGYMLGNCAHCHNPHGDPTLGNPVLKGVLDFLPSAAGGIFQFPLDRVSPRITRGGASATPIPYITPSLLDFPDPSPPAGDLPLIVGAFDANGPAITSAVYAPWRSLIYRNVDAAFSYTQDQALFPHMPRNTAGYDVRARQIMSDWMVSIPAKRKNPGVPEYAMHGTTAGGIAPWDDLPQPYVEVPPGDLAYATAVGDAEERIHVLHSGENAALPPPLNGNYSRYSDKGDTFDILDPAVVQDPVCHAIPEPPLTTNPDDPYPYAQHAHWVGRDLTDPAGAWKPRRSDWPDALVEGKPTTGDGRVCKDPGGQLAAKRDEAAAVALLQDPGARLDSIRAFATTRAPFGLWKAKPGCGFDGVPTVKSFAAAPPRWMERDASLAPGAPVYMQTPGAAVFKMICINCHGPLADSTGRMASNLAEMTGGSARVANFRRGFFGPEESPGDNMRAEFSARLPPRWAGIAPEDVAARYMAWMALGGTKATIPENILGLVGATTVLGEQRGASLAGSANMLSNAKQICLSLLGAHDTEFRRSAESIPGFDFNPATARGRGYLDVQNPRLIRENGDAEMWMQLCTIGNPSPVHVIRKDEQRGQLYMDSVVSNDGDVTDSGVRQLVTWESYTRSARAQTCTSDAGCASIAPGATCGAADGRCQVPVGNEEGGVEPTLTATNRWPWCVVLSGAPVAGLPYCPSGVDNPSTDAANAWAVRGAISAGFSVFTYLQWLVANAPEPDYDHCEARASASHAAP